MARRLSEQERRFAEAFVGEARGNATEAARLAGYSPKILARQGHELLKRERVLKHIEELRAPTTSAAYASRDECRALLTGIIRGEVTEERVTPTGKVVSIAASLVERRKAIESLARIEGWVAGPGELGGGRQTALYLIAGGDISVDLREYAKQLPSDVPTLVLPDNRRRDDADQVIDAEVVQASA